MKIPQQVGGSRWNPGWPGQEPVEVRGNVMYHESLGSWATLRLAKRLVWEFPLLLQKRKKVRYRAVVARTVEKMEEALVEVRRGKVPPPMLVFFYEQKDGKDKSCS